VRAYIGLEHSFCSIEFELWTGVLFNVLSDIWQICVQLQIKNYLEVCPLF